MLYSRDNTVLGVSKYWDRLKKYKDTLNYQTENLPTLERWGGVEE
jgi:hypothetical protein